jgi:hypothetical protein
MIYAFLLYFHIFLLFALAACLCKERGLCRNVKAVKEKWVPFIFFDRIGSILGQEWGGGLVGGGDDVADREQAGHPPVFILANILAFIFVQLA